MRTFTFLCCLLICSVTYSQQWETFGAGVIDFLMTNPKTASKTNAAEAAALSAIRALLTINAQRKHEVNVASAGRDEIIINTNSGTQATIYSDNQGNLYLLSNGIIYPIATSLVNQAKSEGTGFTADTDNPKMNNATLQQYSISDLREQYQFEMEGIHYVEKETLLSCYLENDYTTIEDLALEFKVSPNDIYFVPFEEPSASSAYNLPTLILYAEKSNPLMATELNEIYLSKKPIPRGNPSIGYYTEEPAIMSTFLSMYDGKKSNSLTKSYSRIYARKKVMTPEEGFKFGIVTTFTCNWATDFDGKGYDLDDFQGIKRSFSENENIMFVVVYSSNYDAKLTLTIYENKAGTVVFNETANVKKGGNVHTLQFNEIASPPVVYIYNYKLNTPDGITATKSEKFEILREESNDD